MKSLNLALVALAVVLSGCGGTSGSSSTSSSSSGLSSSSSSSSSSSTTSSSSNSSSSSSSTSSSSSGYAASASDALTTEALADRSVVFDTSAPGSNKSIPIWGLDTAWVSESNIRRGVAFM